MGERVSPVAVRKRKKKRKKISYGTTLLGSCRLLHGEKRERQRVGILLIKEGGRSQGEVWRFVIGKREETYSLRWMAKWGEVWSRSRKEGKYPNLLQKGKKKKAE